MGREFYKTCGDVCAKRILTLVETGMWTLEEVTMHLMPRLSGYSAGLSSVTTTKHVYCTPLEGNSCPAYSCMGNSRILNSRTFIAISMPVYKPQHMWEKKPQKKGLQSIRAKL